MNKEKHGNTQWNDTSLKNLVEDNSEFNYIKHEKTNNKLLIHIRDSEGYKYRINKSSFDDFLRGKQKGFSKVGLSQFYSSYNITIYLSLNKSSLVFIRDKDVFSATEKLKFKCNGCGEHYTISWNGMTSKNIKQCKKCSTRIKGENSRFYDTEKLEKIVNSTKYKFIKYERNKLVCNGSTVSQIYIHFEDSYQFKYRTLLTNFSKYLEIDGLKSFYFVSTGNPYSIENIKTYLQLNESNYTLVSSSYEGSQSKLRLYCASHGEFSMSWGDLTQGKGCRDCWIDSISGENHYLWNPSLTKEERIIRRDYPEYQKWRKLVFDRDAYTCRLCNNQGGTLNAHHLNGYDWAINERLDVENGLTLCKTCHTDFHIEYGYGNNTKDQFKEYMNKYYPKTKK